MASIYKYAFYIQILLCLCNLSCAKFQLVKVEAVENREKYLGILKQETVNYSPIKVSRYPTETSLDFSMYLEKEIEITHHYQRSNYKENVYERPRTSFEEWFELSFDLLEDNPFWGIICLALAPGFATIDTLLGAYVSQEVKREKVPNSDYINFYTKTEKKKLLLQMKRFKFKVNHNIQMKKGS